MIKVNDEYGKLRKVLMASVETFHVHPPINLTQAYYYKNDPPILAKLIAEQKQFIDVLYAHGVDVIMATKRDDCTNQINTRDVAFVIDNTFYVSPMKELERQNEHLALRDLIASFDKDDKICYPNNGIIEGGDIVLNGDRVFVGISQRTNNKGYDWLKKNVADKQIVPIYLKEGFLHLDVVFNLLSDKHALVAVSGIQEQSLELIKSKFDIIVAEESEQISLPTNVFSIDQETVVADPRNKITNQRIAAFGKKVIEIDFSEISKIGGSFRCSTCPLQRE